MSDLSARVPALGAGAATPKSAAFTPGPWAKDRYGSLRGSNGREVTVSGLGLGLVTGNSSSPEFLANARLIAAAPELLDACRAADAALANVTAFEDDARAIMGNTNFAIVLERRAFVRAAIAKALGPAPSTSGATDAGQVPGLSSKPESPAPTREEGR